LSQLDVSLLGRLLSVVKEVQVVGGRDFDGLSIVIYFIEGVSHASLIIEEHPSILHELYPTLEDRSSLGPTVHDSHLELLLGVFDGNGRLDRVVVP